MTTDELIPLVEKIRERCPDLVLPRIVIGAGRFWSNWLIGSSGDWRRS